MSDVWNPFIMALVGAPGAGKTRVAQEFKKLVDPVLEDRGVAPLTVIDGLDKMLEEQQNRAVGVYGDGYVTMMMYFLRQLILDQAMLKREPILLCGTLIENISHVNARIKLLAQMVQTPETEGLVAREIMTGQVLASYLMDERFQLNFGYYLPLPPQIVVPGREKGTFPVEVDEFIRDLKVKAAIDMMMVDGSDQAQKILDDLMDKWTPGTDTPESE